MDGQDYIVCRCEEVQFKQLEEAYLAGAHTAREIKMNTRASMGACQGRICRHLIDSFVHQQNAKAPYKAAEQLSFRPPVRVMTFADLAEED